jgi:hypothetical protein
MYITDIFLLVRIGFEDTIEQRQLLHLPAHSVRFSGKAMCRYSLTNDAAERPKDRCISTP